jgi:hypothetical protein
MALINVYKVIRCNVFTFSVIIPNFVGAADYYETLEGCLHTRGKTAHIFWHEKHVRAGVHKLTKNLGAT